MIELYKILTGKYDEDVSNFQSSYEQEMNQQQEAINTNCINHTQHWTLENTHSHNELLKYGTIFKTSKVVTAPTIMSFESRLDKFWENQPR